MDILEIVLFWLALAATGVSGLIYVRNFLAPGESRFLDNLADDLAMGAFVMLSVTLVIHWLYWRVPEIGVPFSSRMVYTLVLIGAYLLIVSLTAERNPRVKVAGLFVMPIATGLEFYAWAGYRLEYGLTTALRSWWVGMHVLFALMAYGAITFALTLALLHLMEERQLKKKVSLSRIFRKFPSLETLDELGYKTVAFGFVFLFLVIITGAIRAEMLPAWQRWWADPKIVAAFLTWLVFGGYLLSRNLLGWRGRRASLLVVAGFVVAAVTYIINYILPSIHSYGRGF